MKDPTLTRPTDQAPGPAASRPAARGTTAVDPAARPSLAMAAALVAATAVLDGCGGGGSDAGAGPVTPPTGADPAPTAKEAARFLGQATPGCQASDIAHLQAIGYRAWISEQVAMPRQTVLWDWLVSKGYNGASFVNTDQGINNALWRVLLADPDLLRQRVALALSEILVVGIAGLNISWRQFVAAAYYDLLLDNAFGNFRTLLDQVSTSVAMGVYLTFRGNAKANATTGSEPDENYARELQQLFTIGLYQLNPDGSQLLNAGQPVPTYSQADIQGLARVFTGWDLANADNSTPDRMRLPMVQVASRHETGASSFLNTTVPAGATGAQALKIALDTLFAHPNVGPFIGRQLIQRLVTSNPAPAYVARVAAVFADNGSGVRGDLAAVVTAILLDSEARSSANLSNPAFGKLREPVLRFTAWARAFRATSPTDAWAIGDTSDPATRLAQSPLRSGSVFNFFRPGYVPPNTTFSAQALVAPEFQITNESSVAGYVNFLQTAISAGVGDVKADYSSLLPLLATPASLVDTLNLVLAAGQLDAATVNSISSAIATIDISSAAGQNNRLYAAITLVIAAPQFIAQK